MQFWYNCHNRDSMILCLNLTKFLHVPSHPVLTPVLEYGKDLYRLIDWQIEAIPIYKPQYDIFINIYLHDDLYKGINIAATFSTIILLSPFWTPKTGGNYCTTS